MYASRIRHSVADQERLTIEDASVAQHGDGRYSLWFTTSDGNVHKTCVRYSSQNGFAVTDIRRDAEDIGDGEDRTGGTKLQEERVFHLSEARPSSLCMSPDRRFLLVGLMDGQLVSVDADLHSSTLLGRVRSGAPIVSIAYDDHHCCFWVCSADLAITAWDANTLVPLCSVAMQPPEELRREDPFAARVRFMNRLIIVSTGTALLNAMLPQQCVDALKAPRPQRQNLSSAAIHIVDDWFPRETSDGTESEDEGQCKGEEEEEQQQQQQEKEGKGDAAARVENKMEGKVRGHGSTPNTNKPVGKDTVINTSERNPASEKRKRAWWKWGDKSILAMASEVRRKGEEAAMKGDAEAFAKAEALRSGLVQIETSTGNKEEATKQQQERLGTGDKDRIVKAPERRKGQGDKQQQQRRRRQQRSCGERGATERTNGRPARLESCRERHSHMIQEGRGAARLRAVPAPASSQLHVLFREQNMPVHVFAFGRKQEVWCGSHVSACLFVYDIGMRKVLLSWLLPCTGITAIAHHGGSMWVGTKEGMTYAWDATTHAPLMQISFHTDMVRCFAGMGHVLVSGSGSGDSSIVVCNTRELLKRKHASVAASSAVVDGNATVPRFMVDKFGFYRFHVQTAAVTAPAEDACMRTHPAEVAKDYSKESFITKHSMLLEKATVSLEGIGMSDAWDELCAYARARDLDESVSGAEVDQIRAIIMEKKHMFRLGIPEEHRVTMWRFLVRLRTHSIRKFKKVGYYRRMLEYKGTSQTPFPQAGQIEVDLRRTFPNNIHFQSKEQPLMQALDRVLRAFGWHNPRVGYCQGLGQLTAFVSLILEEEDTFWALTAIVEDIMTPNYYCAPLLQAHVDMHALKELVAHYIPNLHIHFHAVGLLYQVFLKWFMTAFVNVLPAFVTLRIWDVFLVEGREVLFRFALAILIHHEAQLLKLDDDDACYSYIKMEVPNTTDVDTLLKIAYGLEDLPECLAELMGALTPAVASRLGSESS